jgi:hypothetical protein
MCALSSVDFERVKIDIIISENAKVSDILLAKGYRRQRTTPFFGDSVFLRGGFRLAIEKERGREGGADWRGDEALQRREV